MYPLLYFEIRLSGFVITSSFDNVVINAVLQLFRSSWVFPVLSTAWICVTQMNIANLITVLPATCEASSKHTPHHHHHPSLFLSLIKELILVKSTITKSKFFNSVFLNLTIFYGKYYEPSYIIVLLLLIYLQIGKVFSRVK